MLCLRIPAVPLLFPEQPVSEIHNPMIVLWIRCAAAIPVASISSELLRLYPSISSALVRHPCYPGGKYCILEKEIG